MKVFTKWITIETQQKYQQIPITDYVESIVFESKIEDGMVLVYTGHTTVGIYLGNTDKYLPQDIESFLEQKIPNDPQYLHNIYGGGNASAHLKNLLVGVSVVIPITNGKMELGQWQGIFLGEFDGPRKRRITVKVMGEAKEES